MIRIFAASSQTGTLLMALLAGRTRGKDSVDILIIDKVRKKKSLLRQVYSTSAIHSWDGTIDLSTHLEDDHDMAHSSSKKLTRKIKTYPLVSWAYALAFGLFMARKNLALKRELLAEIRRIVPGFDPAKDPVEIYGLPGLLINKPLFSLCRNKKLSYLEHGFGDYIHLARQEERTDFFCVFAKSYDAYLQRNQITSVVPHDYVDAREFDQVANQLYSCTAPEQEQLDELADKTCVLLLLDASEPYNPPDSFWTDYIKACIDKVKDPHKYTFLVKPHGLMSEFSQRVSYDYIRASGLRHIIFDHSSTFFNMGAEIFFARMKKKIAYVFSTFSSSIFYISHFYPREAVCVYHYTFCSRYFQNAPPLFLAFFNDMKPFMEQVFTDPQAGICDSALPPGVQ